MKAALITPNPTLDMIFSHAEEALPGKTFFSGFKMRPGGSGVNVARALGALGCSCTLFTILGGETGRLVGQLILNEGMDVRALPDVIETRVTAIQYDRREKRMAVSPSPSFSARAVENLARAVRSELRDFDIVFFGGSFFGDVDAYEILRELLSQVEGQVFLDTRGRILDVLSGIDPKFVKFDIPGDSKHVGDGLVPAALRHRVDSLVCVVSPLALHVYSGGKLATYPPYWDPERRVYGTGDAFVAGVIFGFMNGYHDGASVRCGILAAKSAGPMEEGLGSIDASRFYAGLPQVLEQASCN
jgi:fructose-1-phosphate kinase PfkB-like protein